jgi:hypothetical protein
MKSRLRAPSPSPIGFLLIVIAGVEDGSAIFAGLLTGYLAFIAIHHAVHRCWIEPNSWLYAAKIQAPDASPPRELQISA